MELAADEQLIIFPGYAIRQDDGQWAASMRAWVFELGGKSLWRSLLIESLGDSVSIAETDSERRAILERRLRWFLADNERFKRLVLKVQDKKIDLPRTKADGHSLGEFTFGADGDSPGWQNIHFTQDRREQIAHEVIECVEPEGYSVISDIDDTIKISQVADKSALLRNTFTEPFSPVPGIATLYQHWLAEGLSFHYVSASPWQLYPELDAFMRAEGFPRGSVHLRNFRLKDRAIMSFLQSSREYKRVCIEKIINDFPLRRFILVGDTGEYDPEIYAEMAGRYPQQVAAVLLRHVSSDKPNDPRYGALYSQHAQLFWRVFSPHDGELLKRFKAVWQ